MEGLLSNNRLNRYWQCTRCPQKYRKSHGTRNPALHLTRIHSIQEDSRGKTKRLKHAQRSIEKSIEIAAASELRRIREREQEMELIDQQNQQQVPLLVPESFETLFVSSLD